MAATLTLEQVLGDVRPGKIAYLSLTREQKRALKDQDGAIALDVLRHLLGARPATPERFPLTEGAFQAVARRLGYTVGGKRCRRMIGRLRGAGVVGDAGSYRQVYRSSGVRSGFRVSLFRLGRALRGAGARLSPQRPVGTRRPVKRKRRVRWYETPLAGDLYERPPPRYTRSQLRRMKSQDDVFQGER